MKDNFLIYIVIAVVLFFLIKKKKNTEQQIQVNNENTKQPTKEVRYRGTGYLKDIDITTGATKKQMFNE